ncbi:MAG: 3-phosphoshikimate 1-carboxyvinyltransferase [Chitinophagales bacterium]
MRATIEPGNISGTIVAPPSKSMAQRAYAAALLHHGKSIINNAGNSDDEKAALRVIQQLGATVAGATVVGHPEGAPQLAINCGESGLCARLFTPIAALSDKAIKIEGQGSLLHRPMEGIREILPALNVELKDFNGYVPFTVQGPMRATDIILDASAGSQFLSGLLFALSSCAKAPVTVTVKGLKSKPYIDMTLDMLARFGKFISHVDYKEFYIDPARFVHKDNIEINVESDWSSAAYFLVAGAIAGDITIRNLNVNSAQADKAILTVLQNAGAAVTIDGNSISVKRGLLKAFEFDATDCPDLFPVLAILAACSEGESYIAGVHRLFHKESNRAESITEMLQNFDVPFSMEDDSFCITGVKKLQGTVIDVYGDHRIVMAAAVAALRAGSRVDIAGAEAINKSYPAFFEDLILCGGKCILV